MKIRTKIVIAAFFAALFAALPVSGIVTARADNAEFAATSRAAIMLDADTGTVVFEKNTEERYPIASMVKIMTLSVAFDEIQKREIPLTTMIPVSQNAASMGGSQAFLDAGSEYSLDELLKSIVVASANDSCVAVAEYLFGSVEAFVNEMNAKASEWGMENTAFVNCTGLPKDGQYCCAKDVAVMFGKLIKHEKFFDYAGVWMYDFSHPTGRVTELTNTNKLIKFYNGCDGGKTGYTDAARSCIAVTAKRGDTRLICAVIGAENSKTRNKEVSDLLNRGFADYKTVYAVRGGDVIGEFDVNNGKQDKVSVIAAESKTIFVKTGDKCDITLQPDIGEISAPLKSGDAVGKVNVVVNGSAIAEVPAICASDVDKKGYLDIVEDFIGNW